MKICVRMAREQNGEGEKKTGNLDTGYMEKGGMLIYACVIVGKGERAREQDGLRREKKEGDLRRIGKEKREEGGDLDTGYMEKGKG